VISAHANVISSRNRASKPHGCRGHVTSILGELDHVGTGDEIEQRFRSLDLNGTRPTEIRASAQRLSCRDNNAWIRMTEADGA
jgi:hypothetical protein